MDSSSGKTESISSFDEDNLQITTKKKVEEKESGSDADEKVNSKSFPK